MKIIIASKKYHSSGTIVDNLLSNSIKVLTNEDYFHSEIIVDGMWIGFNTDGLTFNTLRPLKDNWDYCEVIVDDKYDEVIAQWLLWGCSREYDWLGIAKSVVSWLPEDNSKYFCSEFIVDLLQACDVYKVKDIIPATVNPGELKRLLTV